MLKNNKLLTFLVSFVGTGTLLGTGFGAWVFNENGELNLSHSIDGISVEIATEATLGHFKNDESGYHYEPHILVFDEGTNPTDLNDGLSFYKEEQHPVLEGVMAPVRDDELEIIFHKDDSFNEVKYGLKFQIGASVELISDESATAQLTDFIQISDYLYTDGNFVDLTSNFEIVKEFEHEGTEYQGRFKEYKYVMHLNDLFSYKSEDVKPITEDAYRTLYTAFTENAKNNKNWHIRINFTARYIGDL